MWNNTRQEYGREWKAPQPEVHIVLPEEWTTDFLGGSNAIQKEISTMRVGWQLADRCTSLSALCVSRDIDEELSGIVGKIYE